MSLEHICSVYRFYCIMSRVIERRSRDNDNKVLRRNVTFCTNQRNEELLITNMIMRLEISAIKRRLKSVEEDLYDVHSNDDIELG